MRSSLLNLLAILSLQTSIVPHSLEGLKSEGHRGVEGEAHPPGTVGRVRSQCSISRTLFFKTPGENGFPRKDTPGLRTPWLAIMVLG